MLDTSHRTVISEFLRVDADLLSLPRAGIAGVHPYTQLEIGLCSDIGEG